MRALAVGLTVTLLAAACGGGSGGSPSAGSGSPGISGSPSGSAGASASGASPSQSGSPTPGEGEFVNPVVRRDFPDPQVLEVEGVYYAYATGSGNNIELARSEDLVTWEDLRDPLPEIPIWSTGNTWAPEVARIGDQFVMYYTLRAYELKNPFGDGTQCLSYAVSDTPEGPFEDPNQEPFVCQPDLGGSIDGTYFLDEDGSQYLIWKNDGNCCGIPTRFYLQQLSEDGTQLVGDVTDLGVANDAAWERPVNSRIEAPTLWLHEGTYYLFFSGSAHDTIHYAVGYATAQQVRGPYTDAPENPILATTLTDARELGLAGPGHQSIIADKDGDLWMTYHAWDSRFIGGSGRFMWIDELVFEDGKPVVKGPDPGPQAIP